MAQLNKFFTNILIFGLSLNIICFLYGAFKFDPQVQTVGSLSAMTTWFNLTPFTALFSAGAAGVIGVVSLLLKQGTYAIFAMLITALTMIIGPVQAFVLAVPNTIGAWIPANANPTPGTINPITAVISLLFIFSAYWFIFGLVIQRDIG